MIYDISSPCVDDQACIARAFNALPGLSAIDIYSNDSPRIENLQYRHISNYMPSRLSQGNLQIYNSKNNELLLEIPDYKLPNGQIITCAAFGSVNNIKFIQIIDDINETVMPDETKIRCYNLDGSLIKFSVTQNISISRTLDSGKGTEYTKISPGEYRLEFGSPNQNIPSKNINITFNPGRIYTLYFVGSVSPDSKNYAQLNIPQLVLTVDGNTLFSKCNWY